MLTPSDRSDDEPLFDSARMRRHLAYVRSAIRRHGLLVASVFLLIVVTTAAVLWSLPKTYRVEAKLLAHTNAALAVRADAPNNEAPTRTAAETILRRDALLALIDQHDLVRQYRAHRAPAERAMEAIGRSFASQPESDQDRRDAMVELLEKRLTVWTNESTVGIAIDWADPETAVRIVDSAEQDYFESRYAQEVTALSESLGILESHIEGARADVDNAVVALKQVRDSRDGHVDQSAAASSRSMLVTNVAPPPAAPRVDPSQTQLLVSLEAKQRTLADLEDFRNRRLADLQGRLAEQQAVYTESHPAVVDLKQAIASMSGDSLQMKSLRAEIGSLRTEYAQRTGAPGSTSSPKSALSMRAARLLPQLPAEAAQLDLELREDRDPNVMHARAQMLEAMDKYSALRNRVDSTAIDLETAKAAFKYRYDVVTPAHVPRKPTKPNAAMVMLASVLAAAFTALLLAVVVDVHRGRLVDRWQVERLLDCPVIAEIDVPQLPSPR